MSNKLTLGQRIVLEELRSACRKESGRYKEKAPELWIRNQERLIQGDEACVYAMGVITSEVACRLNIPTSSVLATFKRLEDKGLVIRDSSRTSAVKFWWPIGLAAEIAVASSGDQP